MAKNNFVMNFHGSVGEHIDKVDHMTVNIGSDGTIETEDQDNNAAAKAVVQRLKELREANGMTVKETAEKAGIRPSTLTSIEEGRYNTGIRQISNIAKALGAHVEIVKNDSIDIFEIARKASEMRGLKVPEILPNTEDMDVKTIKLS